MLILAVCGWCRRCGAGRGAQGCLQSAPPVARLAMGANPVQSPSFSQYRTDSQVNGLTALVVIALAIAVFVADRVGALRARRDAEAAMPLRAAAANSPVAPPAPPAQLPAAA